MNGKAILLGGNSQSLDNIAGQPIAEYVHTKSGTIHKLEGPVNAKNIIFKATGDYNDGDTWILNNTPVTVTYNGGEELLPTAVLIGDVLQAVVMRNQVRLMLQKPTPQPSISDNWNLTKPVNQRAKDEYIGGDIYAFDRWVLIYGDFGDTNVSLTSDGVKINGNGGIRQFLEADLKGRICTIAVLDSEDNLFIVTSPILHTKNPEWQISKSFKNLWIGFRFREDRGSTWGITIKTLDKALDKTFKAAKIEFGNRFTGWPAWDYGTELAKCQRYQIEIFDKKITGQSYLAQVKAIDSTLAYGTIPIPVSMRDGVLPVIKTDCSADNPYLAFGVCSSGYNPRVEITEISMYSKMNNGVILKAHGSDFIPGNDYQIYVLNTNMHHFLLDANL